MLLGHVTCEIGARCNTVAMVTRMLEHRLFHLESVLDGSIVTQFVKMTANTRVCVVWDMVVCGFVCMRNGRQYWRAVL